MIFALMPAFYRSFQGMKMWEANAASNHCTNNEGSWFPFSGFSASKGSPLSDYPANTAWSARTRLQVGQGETPPKLPAAAPHPCGIDAADLLWRAAGPLLSTGGSSSFRAGMIGVVAQRIADTPTIEDLVAMWLPGLVALGVRAVLSELPTEEPALLTFLSGRPRAGGSLLVFAFDPPPSDSVGMMLESGEDGAPPEPRSLRRVGLVATPQGPDVVRWHSTAGGVAECAPMELNESFTHTLRLGNAVRRGLRSDNRRAALLRWMAFAGAYPERAPTAGAEDAPIRELASAFLFELAGRSRSPRHLRLRRAAEAFAAAREDGDIAEALAQVREALFLDLGLPAVVQRALLRPVSELLSGIERHELVYLARAGTREIKVLAAQRLKPERHTPEVRRTLEQLARDAHGWVRAAVR